MTCEFGDSRLAQRFWDKVSVNKRTGCWEWAASKQQGGYAQYRHMGTMRLGHRVAYIELVGTVPPGLELDHLCRVRHCVNPAHLEPVTRRENTLRGDAPDRLRQRHTARTHCPAGHPYDETNTYHLKDRPGRQCKECTRARCREYQRRKRAERQQMV